MIHVSNCAKAIQVFTALLCFSYSSILALSEASLSTDIHQAMR